MSVADALITVWHATYIYGFWRPITAINLARIGSHFTILPRAQ